MDVAHPSDGPRKVKNGVVDVGYDIPNFAVDSLKAGQRNASSTSSEIDSPRPDPELWLALLLFARRAGDPDDCAEEKDDDDAELAEVPSAEQA